MNRLKCIPAIVAALMLTTVVGCAATSDHESTGQYVDDAALTTKVKAAIVNEPTLKVSEINVETYQGKVQLSGFVSSQDDINKAVDVARNVNGVKEVNNDIRLK
ncbi:BON domain-containing protein [Rugamonas sp.]|uniref:BON domain-containing protein n=1 Tax=Rugamonas sp. TaxID=1926287 RepID=UPI0025F6A1EE|nr:BON domain-containing protein [Rugamonas sp.]